MSVATFARTNSKSVEALPFAFTPALLARVGALANLQKRAPQILIKEAIESYVIQAEAQQNFVRAASVALDDFEKTGLHNHFEELDAWLSSWGTPTAAEMPPCHV